MSFDVRAIAFYLPQFHPIAENDAWWGEGYTEWTRVASARPLFYGHHQPQLPANLGFYDLRVPQVREAQARLAERYGIHGFCYHYYWFSGRRLLEKPLAAVLELGQPSLPYCICWANENWTRRWDGRDDDVLLSQTFSKEDDQRFIDDLIPMLRDPRYIRVDGKPLIVVYRTSLLPNPKRTTKIWRAAAKAAGLDGLYLVRVESFDDPVPAPNPGDMGFDASCEFPPHSVDVPEDKSRVHQLDPEFVGRIYDYERLVDAFLKKPDTGYRRLRGVMPAWDNTARVGRRAHIAANASPEAYQYWLSQIVEQTRKNHPPAEQIVFINAWNEWGEGCHLEPDQRHGLRYLDATYSALIAAAAPSSPHDLMTSEGRNACLAELAELHDALAASRQLVQKLEDQSLAAEKTILDDEKTTVELRAKVEELTARHQHLEAEVSQARDLARDLGRDYNLSQQKLIETQHAYRATEAALDATRNAYEQSDAALKKTQADYLHLQTDLSETHGALKHAHATWQETQRELKKTQTDFQNLSNVWQQTVDELHTAQQAHQSLLAEIEMTKTLVAEAQAQVQAAHAHTAQIVSEMGQAMDVLNQQYADQTSTNRFLRSEIEERERQIAQLTRAYQEQVDYAQSLVQRLHGIYGSTSWLITVPLRRIGRVMG